MKAYFMNWLEPITLKASGVRLELLDQRHHDDLVDATKDGELWTLWYTSVPAPDGVATEIQRRLDLFAQQSMLPFAIIEESSNKAVGMTTFMNVDHLIGVLKLAQPGFENRYRGQGLTLSANFYY